MASTVRHQRFLTSMCTAAMASAVASSFQNMEAYNYFQSGHVHDIKTYRVMSMQSCVKLKVDTARECISFFKKSLRSSRRRHSIKFNACACSHNCNLGSSTGRVYVVWQLHVFGPFATLIKPWELPVKHMLQQVPPATKGCCADMVFGKSVKGQTVVWSCDENKTLFFHVVKKAKTTNTLFHVQWRWS